MRCMRGGSTSLAGPCYVPRLFRKLANAGNFVARSARSQYLDVEFGPGWIAVGDAAMAYDPLSSQGIAKALGHGR